MRIFVVGGQPCDRTSSKTAALAVAAFLVFCGQGTQGFAEEVTVTSVISSAPKVEVKNYESLAFDVRFIAPCSNGYVQAAMHYRYVKPDKYCCVVEDLSNSVPVVVATQHGALFYDQTTDQFSYMEPGFFSVNFGLGSTGLGLEWRVGPVFGPAGKTEAVLDFASVVKALSKDLAVKRGQGEGEWIFDGKSKRGSSMRIDYRTADVIPYRCVYMETQEGCFFDFSSVQANIPIDNSRFNWSYDDWVGKGLNVRRVEDRFDAVPALLSYLKLIHVDQQDSSMSTNKTALSKSGAILKNAVRELYQTAVKPQPTSSLSIKQ